MTVSGNKVGLPGWSLPNLPINYSYGGVTLSGTYTLGVYVSWGGSFEVTAGTRSDVCDQSDNCAFYGITQAQPVP